VYTLHLTILGKFAFDVSLRSLPREVGNEQGLSSSNRITNVRSRLLWRSVVDDSFVFAFRSFTTAAASVEHHQGVIVLCIISSSLAAATARSSRAATALHRKVPQGGTQQAEGSAAIADMRLAR
jgi:hypothetical protein